MSTARPPAGPPDTALADATVLPVAPPSGSWDTSLLEAIRITARADSDIVRQTLFASLRQENRIVDLAVRAHGRLGASWASSLMVSVFGLKSYLTIDPPSRRDCSVVAVGLFANARRQIEYVGSIVGGGQVGSLQTGIKRLLRPRALLRMLGLVLRPRWCLRYVRLLHRLDQRNFLVACRVASAITTYMRIKEILRRHRPGAVLVASDANPEEIALKLVARSMGIPSIFLSHAYTTPVSPSLRFDLSVLEGAEALEGFRAKGPIRGRVMFRGVEGESAPLDPTRLRRERPTVGVFAPKVIGWDRFEGIVRDLQQRFGAERVLIRWHPNMLEKPRLERVDQSNVVQTPASASLGEISAQCDWVVADENSNVNLEVLKRGIPTIAVEGFTILPADRADLYGFVRNRILFPPVQSIGTFDVDAAMAFYSAGWTERFRRYDAGYLRSEEEVQQDIRRAIADLLRRRPPEAAR